MPRAAASLSAATALLTLALAGRATTPEPGGPADASGEPTTSPTPTPETPTTVTPPPAPPGEATGETTGNDQAAYRDGEYAATGWYGSLPSHHDVTLTIEDDAVTAVAITTPAEDETSLGYQQRFAAALPGAIVGRSIDELDVDRLAGSSGCSEGFMDALAQIKEQAAA